MRERPGHQHNESIDNHGGRIPFPSPLGAGQSHIINFVMPGLVPGIHVLLSCGCKDVDGRDIGKRKRRRPSDGYARP
jgi:hypothetical protein